MFVYNVYHVLIIFTALFLSWNINEKKNIWPRGNLNPRSWCQSTDMLVSSLNHQVSPKKGCIKPRVIKATLIFSHSSNVNFHIMTDAIFCMKSLHTTVNVVYILIIFILLFCHGTSLKKISGHVGT